MIQMLNVHTDLVGLGGGHGIYMFNNCRDHFYDNASLVNPETELVLGELDGSMLVKVVTVESEELMTLSTKYG